MNLVIFNIIIDLLHPDDDEDFILLFTNVKFNNSS